MFGVKIRVFRVKESIYVGLCIYVGKTGGKLVLC